VCSPAHWRTLYAAKLVETVVNSSWMVVLMAVPLFAAYGAAYRGGWLYPLLVLGVFLPFLAIAAVVGTAATVLLVNAFPARRARDLLGVIAVLAAGGVVMMLRMVRPERLAKPEGFASLVDYVAELQTPTSPLLPSEWVQRSVMAWLGRRDRPRRDGAPLGDARRGASSRAARCTGGSSRAASARRS
jgi:ABC-2 type transport system permease protein